MKLRRIAALGAALVLVSATAASTAGPPYTVAVGGNSAAGTENVTATSTGVVRYGWRNNAGTIISFNCTSVSFNATVTRGMVVNPLAQIGSTTWIGCRIPGGAARFTQNGVWNVTGTGSNATPALTDSISGFIGKVSLGVAVAANPAVCSFTITGQAPGVLDESTQQLRVNEDGSAGNLTLSNVSGCLGQAQNGNPAILQFTANIASPNGAINLS